VFFANQKPHGEVVWTSDKVEAHGFHTIVEAVNKAREINLEKIIVVRDLFQVLSVEIEQPIVV
jgi:hypothetical protein